MKKALIVALVCVNLTLLMALLFGPTTPKAHGQAFRGAADYLMITGKLATVKSDAVYVVDLAQRRLLAWKFDRTRKRLIPYQGRDLRNDFERERSSE